MSKIITAMYDTTAEAKAVQTKLQSLGIIKEDDTSNGRVFDKSSPGYREGTYSTHEEHGLWASMKNMFDGVLPDEDRHGYEEGVHRGHALLTVTVDDQTEARVREVIDQSNSVDIADKDKEWRSSGWTGPAAGAAATSGTYASADMANSSPRSRTYHSDTGNGPGAASYGVSGAANNAMGNVKQAAGSVFGSESLSAEGKAQETKGEHQMSEAERKADDGNQI